MVFRVVNALLLGLPIHVLVVCSHQYEEPTSLLQVQKQPALALQQRANRRASLTLSRQSDAAFAQRLRQRRHSTTELADSLTQGLQGVMEAVQHFVREEYTEGVSKLGAALLLAIAGPVSNLYNSAEWTTFQREWLDEFEQLPQTVDTFTEKSQAYHSTGSPHDLLMLLETIFEFVNTALLGNIPAQSQTLAEVMAITESIEALVESLGHGWEGFEDGNVEEQFLVMFTGMRTALDIALPEEIQNDENYRSIMTVLDNVMAPLTEHIQDYRRSIAESNVCWKQYASRDWTLPHVCTKADYTYVPGTHYCLKDDTALVQISNKEMETGLQAKKIPEHGFPASCDRHGDYPFQLGRYCYLRECLDGMIPTPQQTRCMSNCQQEFPVPGQGMCGKSAGDVEQAIANMITAVVTTVIDVAVTAHQLTQGRAINSDTIFRTMESFVEMGKPFAKPQCSF